MVRGDIKAINNEEKNKGGRPKIYKTDDLKNILYRYVQEKNPVEVKISHLVKFSGIPIQAWRFNSEIRKEINIINKKFENMPLFISTEGVSELISIPSAEELINTNYKNKPKLIKIVSDLIERYQESFNESLKIGELKKENEKLKKKLKYLELDVEFYKEEMKKMVVQSTSILERNDKGIKENVIDIQKYSETKTTFKDLFED